MLCDKQDFMNTFISVGGCAYRCLGEYGTCIYRDVHAHMCYIYACGSQWLMSGVIPQDIFWDTFFETQSFSWTWSSLIAFGWLAAETFSTFSIHLGQGLKATLRFLHAGYQTWGLTLVQQDWAISLALLQAGLNPHLIKWVPWSLCHPAGMLPVGNIPSNRIFTTKAVAFQ